MKHLIYPVAAVFGARSHTAAAGQGIVLVQQQEEGAPAPKGVGSEDWGGGAATDESKPDSDEN